MYDIRCFMNPFDLLTIQLFDIRLRSLKFALMTYLLRQKGSVRKTSVACLFSQKEVPQGYTLNDKSMRRDLRKSCFLVRNEKSFTTESSRVSGSLRVTYDAGFSCFQHLTAKCSFVFLA